MHCNSTPGFFVLSLSSFSMGCLMIMSIAMGVIFMTLPRMSPTQYYRPILLSPVKDPKPHDGAQSFAGDGVPPLGLVHGDSLVGYASMSTSSHLLSVSLSGHYAPRRGAKEGTAELTWVHWEPDGWTAPTRLMLTMGSVSGHIRVPTLRPKILGPSKLSPLEFCPV